MNRLVYFTLSMWNVLWGVWECSQRQVRNTKLATIPSDWMNVDGRRLQEAEVKLIQEETSRRVEEAVRKKVQEALNSDEVKAEIDAKIQEGRKRIAEEVVIQLEKEKQESLAEARRKEVSRITPSAVGCCKTRLCFL